ncbi:MAG: class I SAM-dependent methyltransferase [Candidatus Helarchaeota archaeon]
MVQKITLEFISELYSKYIDDLKKVRDYERNLYYEKGYSKYERFLIYRSIRYLLKKIGINIDSKKRGMTPQLDDIEAEITYLLIREFKPEFMVEISPCGGYSTSWILNALNDNKFGKLYSYDLIDKVQKYLPKDLIRDNWIFIKGDIKKNLNKLPDKIDYLFMDSDHSAEFGKWYIQNIFPLLKNGTPVSVHDIYYQNYDPNVENESKIVLDWLHSNNINFFTASPYKQKNINQYLWKLKQQLKIKRRIKLYNFNSMIYFIYQK